MEKPDTMYAVRVEHPSGEVSISALCWTEKQAKRILEEQDRIDEQIGPAFGVYTRHIVPLAIEPEDE